MGYLNMTIFRKMFKVKTVGSRKQGNLAPEWHERLPPSTSMVCHEYNETEGWCICELWVSDHPIRTVPRNMKDLNELAKDPCVIEVLHGHPLSPKTLGRLSVDKNADCTEVDMTAKTLKRHGKSMKFMHTRKKTGTHGKEFEQFVLDEG